MATELEKLGAESFEVKTSLTVTPVAKLKHAESIRTTINRIAHVFLIVAFSVRQ